MAQLAGSPLLSAAPQRGQRPLQWAADPATTVFVEKAGETSTLPFCHITTFINFFFFSESTPPLDHYGFRPRPRVFSSWLPVSVLSAGVLHHVLDATDYSHKSHFTVP